MPDLCVPSTYSHAMVLFEVSLCHAYLLRAKLRIYLVSCGRYGRTIVYNLHKIQVCHSTNRRGKTMEWQCGRWNHATVNKRVFAWVFFRSEKKGFFVEKTRKKYRMYATDDKCIWITQIPVGSYWYVSWSRGVFVFGYLKWAQYPFTRNESPKEKRN